MSAPQLPTSEVLNKAADLIEERGWGQGNEAMQPEGAPLCAEGAIAAASGVTETVPYFKDGSRIFVSSAVERCPAYVAVRNYLSERGENLRSGIVVNDDTEHVWVWNDRARRTAPEVIEVLRAAALVEAAREDAALLAEAGRSA